MWNTRAIWQCAIVTLSHFGSDTASTNINLHCIVNKPNCESKKCIHRIYMQLSAIKSEALLARPAFECNNTVSGSTVMILYQDPLYQDPLYQDPLGYWWNAEDRPEDIGQKTVSREKSVQALISCVQYRCSGEKLGWRVYVCWERGGGGALGTFPVF